MKTNPERGSIKLFLVIFILLFPLSGCNLFISFIDDVKPEPTLIPQITPGPTEAPPVVITGLTEVGIINTGDASVAIESGNYIYTAGWNGYTDNFCVIDFSNPLDPVITGRLNVGGTYGITANGQYAYIQKDQSPEGKGVFAIDCTNPLSPAIADTETLGYYTAYQIYYDNGYLYSCSDLSVSIYSCTDPSNIIYISEIPAYNARWAGIQGNYLYFTEYSYPGRLKIYDISTPSSPVLKADFSTIEYPAGIAVDGDYAYIVYDGGIISAIDIKIPSSPREISSIALMTGTSGYFQEMKIKNGCLFVCGNNDFFVVNVNDPYSMEEIASLQTSNNGRTYGFALSGDYAIVSDQILYRVIRIEKGAAEPTPDPPGETRR